MATAPTVVTHLREIREWEWVPLTAPSPWRFRIVDPVVLEVASSIEEILTSAFSSLRDLAVASATDAKFPALYACLAGWARKGAINAPDRGSLAQCAMQGAAVAHAELATTPIRDRYTHPEWHLVLSFMEDDAFESAGPAGVVAFNAAHRGERNSTDWVRALSD